MLCLFCDGAVFHSLQKMAFGGAYNGSFDCCEVSPNFNLAIIPKQIRMEKKHSFLHHNWRPFSSLFLAFLDGDFIKNYSTTIGLWFSKFEFNASFYYFLKWGLETTSNLELIHSMGIVMVSFLALLTCYLLLKNKSKTTELILMILWVLSGYYFISTTVHPWYIISLLLLSTFTNYKFVRCGALP